MFFLKAQESSTDTADKRSTIRRNNGKSDSLRALEVAGMKKGCEKPNHFPYDSGCFTPPEWRQVFFLIEVSGLDVFNDTQVWQDCWSVFFFLWNVFSIERCAEKLKRTAFFYVHSQLEGVWKHRLRFPMQGSGAYFVCYAWVSHEFSSNKCAHSPVSKGHLLLQHSLLGLLYQENGWANISIVEANWRANVQRPVFFVKPKMFFNNRKHKVIQWVACNGRQLPMRREQGLIWHGRWGACDPSASQPLVDVEKLNETESNLWGLSQSPQVCGERFGPSSYRAGSRASRCFGWRHTMGTDLGGVESKPQSAFLHLFLGSTSSSVSGKVLQVPTDLTYLHGTGGWQSTLHRVIWQWSPLGCVSLWYCQVAFFSKRAHCGS